MPRYIKGRFSRFSIWSLRCRFRSRSRRRRFAVPAARTPLAGASSFEGHAWCPARGGLVCGVLSRTRGRPSPPDRQRSPAPSLRDCRPDGPGEPRARAADRPRALPSGCTRCALRPAPPASWTGVAAVKGWTLRTWLPAGPLRQRRAGAGCPAHAHEVCRAARAPP
ncbi:conserved hypothetical protein [Ricinus communis]|uniref:Uncharacterized protein n=1 Tax=Ricinus communis TaxID=3988 RepID=B9TN27_RICCO|nr:conserved hypothetical protein [Ricinus communis]